MDSFVIMEVSAVKQLAEKQIELVTSHNKRQKQKLLDDTRQIMNNLWWRKLLGKFIKLSDYTDEDVNNFIVRNFIWVDRYCYDFYNELYTAKCLLEACNATSSNIMYVSSKDIASLQTLP